jgi:sirohydrochlorin ferrochelatase
MTTTRTGTRGLLIVDHGSRNAEANARLAAFARRVAETRPDWLVEHAHMELASPDFEAGIDALVARGARAILVHLHFLGTGLHVRETIPRLATRVRARHPAIEIELSTPLGEDLRLLEIVLDQMSDAEASRERQSSKA